MAIDYDAARAKVQELSRLSIDIVDMLNLLEREALFIEVDSVLTVQLTQEQIVALTTRIEAAADHLIAVADEVKDIIKEV